MTTTDRNDMTQMHVKRPTEFFSRGTNELSAVERIDELLRQLLVSIGAGYRPSLDEAVRLLCELKTLNDAALREASDMANYCSALSRPASTNRPRFEFFAKATVIAETDEHDVIAHCIGIDRWVISLFAPDSDEGVDAGRVFTRAEVRRYVTHLSESERS